MDEWNAKLENGEIMDDLAFDEPKKGQIYLDMDVPALPYEPEGVKYSASFTWIIANDKWNGRMDELMNL